MNANAKLQTEKMTCQCSHCLSLMQTCLDTGSTQVLLITIAVQAMHTGNSITYDEGTVNAAGKPNRITITPRDGRKAILQLAWDAAANHEHDAARSYFHACGIDYHVSKVPGWESVDSNEGYGDTWNAGAVVSSERDTRDLN